MKEICLTLTGKPPSHINMSVTNQNEQYLDILTHLAQDHSKNPGVFLLGNTDNSVVQADQITNTSFLGSVTPLKLVAEKNITLASSAVIASPEVRLEARETILISDVTLYAHKVLSIVTRHLIIGEVDLSAENDMKIFCTKLTFLSSCEKEPKSWEIFRSKLTNPHTEIALVSINENKSAEQGLSLQSNGKPSRISAELIMNYNTISSNGDVQLDAKEKIVFMSPGRCKASDLYMQAPFYVHLGDASGGFTGRAKLMASKITIKTHELILDSLEKDETCQEVNVSCAHITKGALEDVFPRATIIKR